MGKHNIVFLNGTAGSGKSFVASKLQKHGFTRVIIDTIYHHTPRINPDVRLFEDIPYMKKTWKMAEKELLSKAQKKSVIFESTGINQPWWNKLYNSCKKKHGNRVKIVHVHAPLSTIWKRVKIRNKTMERKGRVYTYARLQHIHNLVRKAGWKPDHKIINKEKNQTLKQIKMLLEKLQQ